MIGIIFPTIKITLPRQCGVWKFNGMIRKEKVDGFNIRN